MADGGSLAPCCLPPRSRYGGGRHCAPCHVPLAAAPAANLPARRARVVRVHKFNGTPTSRRRRPNQQQRDCSCAAQRQPRQTLGGRPAKRGRRRSSTACARRARGRESPSSRRRTRCGCGQCRAARSAPPWATPGSGLLRSNWQWAAPLAAMPAQEIWADRRLGGGGRCFRPAVALGLDRRTLDPRPPAAAGRASRLPGGGGEGRVAERSRVVHEH